MSKITPQELSDLLAFASQAPQSRTSTPQVAINTSDGTLKINTAAKKLVASNGTLTGIFTSKGNPITSVVRYTLKSSKYSDTLVKVLEDMGIVVTR